MSGTSHTGRSGLGRSSDRPPRRVPRPAARMSARVTSAPRSCAFHGDEAAIVDGADGLGVELLRSDPGDDAGFGQAAHVFQAAHEERLAELLAAMRGIGARGAEPAEALVVAVG